MPNVGDRQLNHLPSNASLIIQHVQETADMYLAI